MTMSRPTGSDPPKSFEPRVAPTIATVLRLFSSSSVSPRPEAIGRFMRTPYGGVTPETKMRSLPPDVLTEERRVARGRNARTFGDSAVTRGRSSYRRPGDITNRFCSSEVSAAFGTTTAVPSQLIPANPVVTLSMTPSKTDVRTTRTKTPSIRSVSVRTDRSLCAQSSRKPPRTTSNIKARRARTPKRRPVCSRVRVAAGTARLLMVQTKRTP